MTALTGRLENVFGADYSEVFGFRTPGRTIAVGIRAGL
jgi:outer membrane cobalamin receptor